MSLFDRYEPDDVDPTAGLTVERIREVCDAIPDPDPYELHPSRTRFTPEEVDRLWVQLFPAEVPAMEARLSPARRARLDQLRAALRSGEL